MSKYAVEALLFTVLSLAAGAAIIEDLVVGVSGFGRLSFLKFSKAREPVSYGCAIALEISILVACCTQALGSSPIPPSF